jgi:hypothetical protein
MVFILSVKASGEIGDFNEELLILLFELRTRLAGDYTSKPKFCAIRFYYDACVLIGLYRKDCLLTEVLIFF